MVEFRPGVAVNIDNRKEKREAYRVMAAATYPMLYALSADLAAYDPSAYSNISPVVFRRPGRPVSIKPQTVESLEREQIGTTPSSFKSYNEIVYDITTKSPNELEDDIKPYSHSLHNFAAATDEDRHLYRAGQRELVKAIGKIGSGNSQTVSVAEEFAARFPDMDSRFALDAGQIAVMDGVFSRYTAATWLSQRPIQGLESLPTRERLLAILRSDVVTDFTKKFKLGVLAKLASLYIIPQQQIVGTKESDLELHPDTERFVELFNANEALVVPQPMICPFAVPLGTAQAERTINDYQGSLSVPIVSRIRDNAHVSGINTVGIAIADFLESRI